MDWGLIRRVELNRGWELNNILKNIKVTGSSLDIAIFIQFTKRCKDRTFCSYFAISYIENHLINRGWG